MLYRQYFKSKINKPTRISNNFASILDHIWINFNNKVDSGIVTADITDHFITFCKIYNYLSFTNKEKIKLKFRDFSNININKFKNPVGNVGWEDTLEDYEHPDKFTNNLLDKLYNMYNSCFPIKTKSIVLKRLLNTRISKGILKSNRIKHIKYN